MKKIKMWKFTPVLALVPVGVVSSLLINQTPNEIERMASDPNFRIKNNHLVAVNELGQQQIHLEIPIGVTSIQQNAFQNCPSLRSIVIPRTVTSIAANAFENCPHLNSTNVINNSSVLFHWWVNNHDYDGQSLNQMTEVDLMKFTNSEGQPFTIIGEKAFSDTQNLSSIIIPNEVKHIEANAFNGINKNIKYHVFTEDNKNALINANIASPKQIILSNDFFITQENTLIGLTNFAKAVSGFLSIPDGVTSITAKVFEGCLPKKIMFIPKHVTSIEKDTFKNFTNQTKYCIESEATKKVLIDANIESHQIYQVEGNFLIQDGRLTGLIDIREITPTVNIPHNIHTIDFAAFKSCNKLETINIPEGVININAGAFDGCEFLENVNLPNSLKWIDIGAFSGCSSLKEITIPENVVYIGNNVFKNCTNLEKVTNNSPILFDWWVKNHQYGDKTLNQMEKINLGKFTNSNSKPFTMIGDNAFQDCNKLQSLTISNNMKRIPYYAFDNCGSLKKVIIPPSVKHIDNFAFAHCKALSNVKIFTKNIEIGKEAFADTPKTAKFFIYYKETKQALINANIKEEQIVLINYFIFENDKLVGFTDEGKRRLCLLVFYDIKSTIQKLLTLIHR